jgi:transcriptional regulator
MYTPKHFDQPDIETLHMLMRERPLATVVTMAADGLNANHFPLHLSLVPSPLGTLRGHCARANLFWSDFAEDVEVLVIFHGPDAYITPSFYPSKQETGKVVPTWNYAVAHAYGRLRIMDDAAWLRTHLAGLTAHHEAALAQPWQLTDAPADYTEKLMRAIVGFEIDITRLTGKWKVSQNRSGRDQKGVVEGLRASTNAKAMEMAALVDAGKQGSHASI